MFGSLTESSTCRLITVLVELVIVPDCNTIASVELVPNTANGVPHGPEVFGGAGLSPFASYGTLVAPWHGKVSDPLAVVDWRFAMLTEPHVLGNPLNAVSVSPTPIRLTGQPITAMWYTPDTHPYTCS